MNNDLGRLDRRDSELLLNVLLAKELVNVEKRTIKYKAFSKGLADRNAKIKEDYDSPEDLACLIHKPCDRKTLNHAVKMLFDIVDGVYDGSHCPTRRTMEAILAVALPRSTPVLTFSNRWKYGIKFIPIDRTSRTNLKYSSKTLDGGQILEVISSLTDKVRSLLITNPIVIPYLESLLEHYLEDLYLVLPDVEGNSFFEQLADQRGFDLFDQQGKYQEYFETALYLADKYSDKLNVRIIKNRDVFLFDWSLVVSNIDLTSGEFENCVVTNNMEALYADNKCSCQFGEKSDEYSNLVKKAVNQWHF